MILLLKCLKNCPFYCKKSDPPVSQTKIGKCLEVPPANFFKASLSMVSCILAWLPKRFPSPEAGDSLAQPGRM